MINLRKNRENLRSAMVAFSAVFGGFRWGCLSQRRSESPASTGGADAKMATDKIAEAEPLYGAGKT